LGWAGSFQLIGRQQAAFRKFPANRYPKHFKTQEVDMTAIRKFFTDESGATAIEYGLIAALVSVAGVTALSSMGDGLGTLWGSVTTNLQ